MAKKDNKKEENQVAQLEEKIIELEKQLIEGEEITKRAQSDYFRLKMDMDALVQRTQTQTTELKNSAFIDTAKQILPVISQLDTVVTTLPDDVKETQWGKSIILSYEKMVSTLKNLNIEKIDTTVGREPDLTLHIPIGTQATEEKELKGKIVAQVEVGYVTAKDGREHTIIPAKVLVGE